MHVGSLRKDGGFNVKVDGKLVTIPHEGTPKIKHVSFIGFLVLSSGIDYVYKNPLEVSSYQNSFIIWKLYY